jgi:hypothetical protein
MSISRFFVAILPALLMPMWAAAGDTWDVVRSESLPPFVKEWRVVLKDSEAQGLQPDIRGWTLENELDAVEAMLLPKLAADLEAVGASALPCDYYRQYAAGRSRQYHLLFIRGFRRSHLSADADGWRHAAVEVSDGGSSYWDAIYIVELHRFAKMKTQERRALTVAFHGVA